MQEERRDKRGRGRESRGGRRKGGRGWKEGKIKRGVTKRRKEERRGKRRKIRELGSPGVKKSIKYHTAITINSRKLIQVYMIPGPPWSPKPTTKENFFFFFGKTFYSH